MPVRQIFVVVVAFLFAWPVMTALRTGRIDLTGGRISRADHPVTYWAILAIGLVLVILVIVLGYGALPERFPA